MRDNETAAADNGLTIGDVAKMCDVPAYTIRYWEKEFGDYLSPVRTVGKQRRYCESHIRQVLHIKKLLWEDRFSIRGAQRLIKGQATFNSEGGRVRTFMKKTLKKLTPPSAPLSCKRGELLAIDIDGNLFSVTFLGCPQTDVTNSARVY